jgi:hypothetical protein
MIVAVGAGEHMTASIFQSREEIMRRRLRVIGLWSVLTGLGGRDMSVRVRREATLAFEAGLYVCGSETGLLCVSGGCGLGIGVLPESFNEARVFIGSGDLSQSVLCVFAQQDGMAFSADHEPAVRK